MIYMILVSPNCIEIYDSKMSYEHSCILSIFIEFSWLLKRVSMSFQRVKLWVEFLIWIWYSKIIIELFKRFHWVYEFHEILWVFIQTWVWVIIEILSFEVWYLISHELLKVDYHRDCVTLWVARWAIPMRWMSRVMSYELWVILMSRVFWPIWVMSCYSCIELSLSVGLLT